MAGDAAPAFGDWMTRLAAAEGDPAESVARGDAAHVVRPSWRLMRGIESSSPAVFEAWNGLIEGALAVHNRFLVLEVLRRLDYGDDAFEWRIRPMGRHTNQIEDDHGRPS